MSGDFELKLSASDEKKITVVVQKKFAKYVAKWRTKKVKDLETFLKKNIDDFKKERKAAEKSKKTDEFNKGIKKWVDDLVDKVNISIQRKVDRVNDVAERLLTEAVAKVVNKSTTMAKIVAIVKIVAFAAVAIASAAMAIAASVASGGAAAVLILGAIVTGAQALGKIVGQYMDVYPSLEKSTKTLAQVMAPLIGEIKVAEMLDEGDPKDLLKNNPKLQLLFKPVQKSLVEMQVWQNKLSTQIALMEQENKRYEKKIAKRSTLKKEDFDEKDWKKLEIEGKKIEAEFDHFTKQLPQLAKKLAMVKKFTDEVESLVGKQDLDTGEWDSAFKSLKNVVKEKWEIAKLTVSSPDAMLDLAVEASKG